MPELESNFQQVLTDRTAGDPMREDARWTNLSRPEIAARLTALGTPVGPEVVRQLLKKHGLGQRQARKSVAMGSSPDRNAQFEQIAALRKEYEAAGNPILSMDTKKRELLGNFFRPGTLYAGESAQVFDHDFPTAAEGWVIPHGIYDLLRNVGHIHLGVSHDTSPFACECLRRWWQTQGRPAYPRASSILLLCDGGGSNSASRYVFKEALQGVADEIGVPIRVAHYPPYCSKYNPIEHRLFPHVTRACQGVVFRSLEVVQQLIARTHTRSGLRVTVDILRGTYETGLKVAAQFKQTMRIAFAQNLPRWNYTAIPAAPTS
jgi:hypothetical protein